MDIAGFVKALKVEKKIAIDGGYGKIKGKTFRISNMGNETDDLWLTCSVVWMSCSPAFYLPNNSNSFLPNITRLKGS